MDKKEMDKKEIDNTIKKLTEREMNNLDKLFNTNKTKELYTKKNVENFSYSKKLGHMNEYKKAINNHQQNIDKPFNKIDGVGV